MSDNGDAIREWLLTPWRPVPPIYVSGVPEPPWDAIGTVHLPDAIRRLFVSSETGHLIAATDFALYRIVDGKRMRVKKIKT